MSSIFSLDNIFFRTVNKIVDLMWLNVLTIICALPIFTAGASVCALYGVLLRMVRGEEGNITKSFFSGFKTNFKNATKIWLILAVVAAFYGADYYVVRCGMLDSYPLMKKIFLISVFLIGFCWMAFSTYVFPLFARYDQGFKQTVKNAASLAVVFLPRTLCLVVILVSPVAFMMLSNYFLFLWPLYGLALPGYFCCMILRGIFDRVEKQVESAEG